MTKVPYEVIEFRELKALNNEYSWKMVFIYWLYLKMCATVLGIGLSLGFCGLSSSWLRNIFFWRYEIVEALLWIPMMIACALVEYLYIVLSVHKKMGVVCRGREYFKVN
jgi:hypothetical protein